MTVYTDNPAGRLHELLTRFQRNSSQQPVYSAWAGALGIAVDDLPELLRALALLVGLPAEIETEVDRVDPEEFDRDSTMRWQGHAVSLLGPSLFGTERADQVASKVNEGWLGSLETCSFVLHKYRRQIVISDGDLERIKSLIADLRVAVEEELAAGDELRDFLLHHATAMARALIAYQIRGPAALEDAFDQAIGGLARRGAKLDPQNRTGRKAWEKFGALIGVVAAALAIPVSTIQLASNVRGAIEGPPSPPAEKVIIDQTIVVPPEQAPTVSTSSPEPANGAIQATPKP